MREGLRGVVCGRRQLAQLRQRVEHLAARALAVEQQAEDVAAVRAAAGEGEVLAPAPGDARKLKVARGGRGVGARAVRDAREPREPLDAAARGEERVAHALVGAARRGLQQRLDLGERGGHGALGPLARKLRVASFVRPCARTPARDEEEGGDGPRESGQSGGGERARAARGGGAASQEEGDAEGGGRREVECDDFAQTHDTRGKGNGHAGRRPPQRAENSRVARRSGWQMAPPGRGALAFCKVEAPSCDFVDGLHTSLTSVC